MSTLTEIRGTPPLPGMCQVLINSNPCCNRAESTWAGGCVHEHVTTGIGICAKHRKLAERPFDCVRCEPDHVCKAQLREVAA